MNDELKHGIDQVPDEDESGISSVRACWLTDEAETPLTGRNESRRQFTEGAPAASVAVIAAQ